MSRKITENEWLEDFKDFVEAKDASVPEDVSKKILSYVHRALNPSAWVVFLKLLSIHAVVGTLSLGVCNQFGMSPFHTGFSLSEYFMKFGHSVCMTLCGFLFLGLTVSFSKIVLRPEEFIVLKRNTFVQVFFLSLASIVAFLAFGAELVFGALALWLVGALLGGLATIQLIGPRIRTS